MKYISSRQCVVVSSITWRVVRNVGSHAVIMCDFMLAEEIHRHILARDAETLSKFSLMMFKYNATAERLAVQMLFSPAVCFSL